MEWKTIDSAPKDGSNILVYSQKGEQIARWVEGWNRFLTTDGGKNLRDVPSHWMPLPTPPQ